MPDGDLFEGINSGKASVVTDEIDTFTETGIALKSGEVLEADIIVTATGFNLNVLGDIAFTIDDEPLDFSETVSRIAARCSPGSPTWPGCSATSGRAGRCGPT